MDEWVEEWRRYTREQDMLRVLTFKNRLKLCIEILTIRSGHRHPAHEKQLSIFIRGYNAGFYDGKHEQKHKNII
jgi:hypothetical protein